MRLFVVDAAVVGTLQRRPPSPTSRRRAALRTFYAARDCAAREARIEPAIALALDAVGAANADLLRVLRDQPDLSAKECRRVAMLDRQRLLAGLNQVAALAVALKGP